MLFSDIDSGPYRNGHESLTPFVRGTSTTFLLSQVRDEGLICCLMPGRPLVGDTTPTDPGGNSPLSGVQLAVFSQFSRRSRGGVSEFTVIFLDRHGQFWEYDEVVDHRPDQKNLTMENLADPDQNDYRQRSAALPS
ncbi:hypothetical protein EVAR_31431_1 [Eumeta japonica]|uniref:Uncharacterized protein n=1 Tax=Eumeta variegata TaxID=151549 RepID=A0A4C1UZ57_EUMVA|nr:hypothetical protein EVAR_31431_1 [Eumeta japonica]